MDIDSFARLTVFALVASALSAPTSAGAQQSRDHVFVDVNASIGGWHRLRFIDEVIVPGFDPNMAVMPAPKITLTASRPKAGQIAHGGVGVAVGYGLHEHIALGLFFDALFQRYESGLFVWQHRLLQVGPFVEFDIGSGVAQPFFQVRGIYRRLRVRPGSSGGSVFGGGGDVGEIFGQVAVRDLFDTVDGNFGGIGTTLGLRIFASKRVSFDPGVSFQFAQGKIAGTPWRSHGIAGYVGVRLWFDVGVASQGVTMRPRPSSTRKRSSSLAF